jgi:cold shock CspA family protein
MQQGFVRWFDPVRRFGFIHTDQGQEIFVHALDIIGELPAPAAGTRVSFELGSYLGREKAVQVRTIGNGAKGGAE